MAIDLLAAVKQVALPKSVGKGHIQIRVGIHTGACNTSSFCFGYKIIYTVIINPLKHAQHLIRTNVFILCTIKHIMSISKASFIQKVQNGLYLV